MSEQDWAAIVYGRSYHLDFRFITIPQDFSDREIDWVLPYILATTQKARNLADCPRWSLFKNDSHCVVGVTCMVRDLIDPEGEDSIEIMAKDDQNRPLYVFVGYVTKLTQSISLHSVPAYTEQDLSSFKPLYREIEKVWLLRNYDDRKPFLSEYKFLDSRTDSKTNIITLSPNIDSTARLNDRQQYPDKTFLWQKSSEQNDLLWLASAQCRKSTSTCLNIKGKCLSDSPFLNQTISNIEDFAIVERIATLEKSEIQLSPTSEKAILERQNFNSPSLKQKISQRAKQDIDLTLQQAAKVRSLSQETIGNLANWSNNSSDITESYNYSEENNNDFGFKAKKSPEESDRDWF